jgi:bacteriocin-like protein
MKKINNTELEKINGGNIINDICFGADAGYITYKVAFRLLARRGIQMIAMGPIGEAVGIACLAYSMYSWLDSE